MKTAHKLFFYTLLFCPFLSFSQPQNNKVGDVVMPAPTAAALGKFGDIPVSYFTGVPNISVPIHTIKEGNVSLPLSMSYHASGVKLSEPMSATGNWALVGAGMITRTTMGIADEVGQGYFKYADSLLNPVGAFNDIEVSEQIAAAAKGDADAEPDMFSFNVGGFSGKFFFDKNRNPRFVPQQDIELSYQRRIVSPGDTTWFEQFTLITPDGTSYIFGKLDSDPMNENTALERTFVNSNTDQPPSSWYLRRVISHDEVNEIQLEYEEDIYAYATIGSCKVDWGKTLTFSTSLPPPLCSSVTVGQNLAVNTQQVKGWRLKSILNSSGTNKVDFHYLTTRQDLDTYLNQTGKQLDRIDVSSGDYCKSFDLFYSYFLSGGNNSYDKRLKLDSLRERACDNSDILPAWKFDYIGEISDTLPSRYSRETDHWGFYNGASNNEGTHNIPPVSVPWQGTVISPNYGNADRESHENFMKVGTLEKITYPTGGHTFFEYGANEVTQTVSGGSSFKSITDELRNCDNTSESACCTVFEKMREETFTADEIDGAKFRINVTQASCDAGNDFPKVTVMVKRASQPTFGEFDLVSFNTSFSCMNQNGACNLEGLLSDFISNTPFVADTAYVFRLILDNESSSGEEDVLASFQLFSEIPNDPELQSREVGGLRIEKITIHDGISTDNDIVKTYDYQNSNGYSSATLYFEPTYYGYQEGVFGEILGLSFHSTSVVPLANYNGYHLGYQRVVENHNGNGQTEYLMRQEFVLESQLDRYPYTPDLARVLDGLTTDKRVYKESGEKIVDESTDYLEDYTYLENHIIYKGILYTDKDGNQGHYAKTYRIRTAPAGLTTRVTSIQDGVRTITDYEYDTHLHLAPTAIEVQDDREEIYRTEYSYPFDDQSVYGVNFSVFDSMVSRNMIATPIQTLEINNGLPVRGSRTLFNFFDKSTGGLVTSGSTNNTSIYPNRFYQYEMTFNADNSVFLGGNSGWVWDGTISQYDPDAGRPSNYTKIGWQPETYNWNPVNKLIESRKFEGFLWQYSYHDSTQMVSTIRDIDGQKVQYEYDELMRLKTTSARGDSVQTSFAYVYGGPNNNYVEQTTNFAPDPTGNSILTNLKTRQFTDGLGREVLNVQVAHAQNGRDVVSATTYDKQGRVQKQYEPLESTFNNGSFFTVPINSAHTFTSYEASPLNRVDTIIPPDWYATITEYGANEESDDVRDFDVASTAFEDGTLYKVTTTDPNGNKAIVFTDYRGKVMLNRRTDNTGDTINDTYTRYDLRERPKIILPPGIDPNQIEPNLLYEYRYNQVDQVVAKKFPDAVEMEMIYDNRDLLIAQRDSNLIADGKWMVTEYDVYGRPTKTGLNTSPTSLANEIWTETFYDGSDGTLINTDSIYIGKPRKTNAYILNGNTATSTPITTTFTYDPHGRVRQTTGNNHLGGSETITSRYDFADNLVVNSRQHQAYNKSLVSINTNTYDSQGRLINTFHQKVGQPKEWLTHHKYTVKDELLQQQMGVTSVNDALQLVDYQYKSNGFLTHINPTLSGDDLFRLELNYNSGSTLTPNQFNGNISQMTWQVSGELAQTYGFNYDYLDRLEVATSDTEGGTVENNYTTSYSYDARGNITNLVRHGLGADGINYGKIDDLNFGGYTGSNQFQTITDAVTSGDKVKGFKPGPGGTYSYDPNGNLTNDPHKGITIDYNYLNLPSTVTRAGSQIVWTYDGTGKKLKKEVIPSTPTTLIINDNPIASGIYEQSIIQSAGTVPTSNTVIFEGREEIRLENGFTANGDFTATITGSTAYVQDYCDEIEYRDGELEAIYNDAGRLFFAPSGSNYHYGIKDHLGNTRVLFTKSSEQGISDILLVLQSSAYYPFGLQMEGAGLKEDTSHDYLYNGKELDTDFGLNWYHYGARMYDPAIARFTGVDPLAETMPSWGSYTYGFNNPVRFTDPTGMKPDDTIIFDESGNELYRQKDNLPDAIVVVNNSQRTAANNLIGVANTIKDKRGTPSDGLVSQLRETGDTYFVDGMEQLYDKSMSETTDQHDYVDKNGNPRTDIHPESAATFVESGNGKKVDMANAYSGIAENVGLASDQTTIHTHPDNGALFSKLPSGAVTSGYEKPGPSQQDKRRNYGKGRIDFVIGKDNIYLVKNYNVGIAPRNFFKQ